LNNQPELLLTYLAILKAGSIPIMVLPPYQEAEMGFFAKLADARGLAISTTFRNIDKQRMAENIAQEVTSMDIVLVTGGAPRQGFHSLDKMLADPIEERIYDQSMPRPDPDSPALLLLSGGTTGIPKLIPRT